MALQIGLVGLPNVGKSTLFNALTRSGGANVANYPFCTIDPNVGIVEVPDERLNKLATLAKPEKILPAVVEFVDIAGLVAGASKGEGLGNQFLAHIRECSAIAEVVRVFEDSDIIHVNGKISPQDDVGIIHTELLLADLQSLEKQISRLQKDVKGRNPENILALQVAEKIKIALEAGQLASEVELSAEEKTAAKILQLLTLKPILFVANLREDEVAQVDLKNLHEKLGANEKIKIVPICAKLEAELASFTADEAQKFLEDAGLKEPGLNRLIREAYDLLGLQTYFTVGPKEVRAWTIQKGATAPEAAGVIHTDFQKGFIAAEIAAYEDFINLGGEAGAREKGKLRVEGKEYILRDGDVCHFRFNV
jgi:hypothetical protein